MRRALPFAGLALGALLALPASAQEGDTLRPFASYGSFYDSNLFRLSRNESPNVRRDDRYGALSAGLKMDLQLGRQQIVASAAGTRVRYEQNAFLDYDGHDYQAIWNWRLGNHLSGNLGANESLSQSSFTDLGRVNNQVARKRIFGRADWEFHPRWRAGAGSEQVDVANSASSLSSQNFRQQIYDVGLTYLTPKGSNLRAQVRRLDAQFPRPQILAFGCIGDSDRPFCFPAEVADNSYKQTEYNLLGDWRSSSKLTLRGQLGWVERKYENVQRGVFNFFTPQLKTRPDFSGYTGRLSADWFVTTKALLSLSAYQELGSALDINASSVLKKGASVSGAWLVREKWRLNAGASFENRDFRGVPGTSLLQRNDDTLSGSLSLSYTPIRAVSLDLGLRAGRRDSNITDEDYEFHTLFANVRADY